MLRDYFSINLDKILNILYKEGYYSNTQLFDILNNLKEKNLVSTGLTFNAFYNKLISYGLRQYSINIRNIDKIRYTLHKEFNIYLFAKSLEKKPFFPMSTALNIQGLSSIRNSFVFISKERLKRVEFDKSNIITQDKLDKAFSKSPRRTKAHARLEEYNIVILETNYTNAFEIIDYKGYRVSSINRAFVEMISNVHYFQSPDIIIKTFRSIKEQLTLEKIYNVIEKFDFVYPYYQLAGFYLEQIGFSKDELFFFYEKKINLKFYTCKNQINYKFNDYWNIYY